MARKRPAAAPHRPVRKSARATAAQKTPMTSGIKNTSTSQIISPTEPLLDTNPETGNEELKSLKRPASSLESGQNTTSKKLKKTVRFDEDVRFEPAEKFSQAMPPKRQMRSTKLESDTPSSTFEPVQSDESEGTSFSSDNMESSAHSAALTAISPIPIFPADEFILTDEFFGDIGNTIAKVFPFEQFAQEHRCNVSVIAQAVTATVIAPLSDPSFCWQEDNSITIAQYGKMMMESWRQHYAHALETSVDSDNTGSEDTSDESSDSESIDSSFVNTAPGESDGESEGDGDTAPGGHTDHEGAGVVRSGIGKGPRNTSITSDPSGWGYYENDEYCNFDIDGLQGTSKTKNIHPECPPPSQPVARQWVYRDEFGNFVPVPTWEELEAQEEEERHQREINSLRRRRGKLKSPMRPELPDEEELDDHDFLQTIDFGTRTDDGGYTLPTTNTYPMVDPRPFSDADFSSEKF